MTTPHDPTILTEEQWQQYERDGFLRLGKLLAGEELQGLQDRIDAIMLGEADVAYHQMLMQLGTCDGDVAGNSPRPRASRGQPSTTVRSKAWSWIRRFIVT